MKKLLFLTLLAPVLLLVGCGGGQTHFHWKEELKPLTENELVSMQSYATNILHKNLPQTIGDDDPDSEDIVIETVNGAIKSCIYPRLFQIECRTTTFGNCSWDSQQYTGKWKYFNTNETNVIK